MKNLFCSLLCIAAWMVFANPASAKWTEKADGTWSYSYDPSDDADDVKPAVKQKAKNCGEFACTANGGRGPCSCEVCTCENASPTDSTLVFTGDRMKYLKFVGESEFVTVLIVKHGTEYIALGTKSDDPHVIPIATFSPGDGSYKGVAALWDAKTYVSEKKAAKGRVRYDICNGNSCTTFECDEGDPIPFNARNIRFVAAPTEAKPAAKESAPAVTVSSVQTTSASVGGCSSGSSGGGLFSRIRDRIASRREARAERGGFFGFRSVGGGCSSCGN